MTRRTATQTDDHFLEKAVADAFQATTADERKDIASLWFSQHFDAYREFAEKRQLMPAALIIACLDEVNHPIITQARSWIGLSAIILRAEIGQGYLFTPCG